MKIGILSDTHDQVERTSRAVAALVGAGAEALVHCGDLTVPEVVLECGGLPSYFVFGNNDFDRDGLLRAMALVGGRSLGRGGEVVLDGGHAWRLVGRDPSSARGRSRLPPVRPFAPGGRRATGGDPMDQPGGPLPREFLDGGGSRPPGRPPGVPHDRRSALMGRPYN
jgi:hypothetical protein